MMNIIYILQGVSMNKLIALTNLSNKDMCKFFIELTGRDIIKFVNSEFGEVYTVDQEFLETIDNGSISYHSFYSYTELCEILTRFCEWLDADPTSDTYADALVILHDLTTK